MSELKKEIKQVKSYSLKPINIAWLKKTSLAESTPEERVSDSAVLDRLIDQAREQEESQSPSRQKKTARAAEAVFVTI